MSAPTLPLIICFGDSLTAGFQSPTAECPDYQETPYGRFLAERLGDRARVQISGVCGELTAEMDRYLLDQAKELVAGGQLRAVPDIAKGENKDLLRKAMAGR